MIRTSVAAVTVALLVTAGAAPLPAQTLELHALQSWSGYEELSSPTGFGIAWVSPERGLVTPRVGYSYRTEVRTGPGIACTGLIFPDDDCPLETVEEDFDLHALDVGLALIAPLGSRSEARLNVLGILTRVHGKRVGRETGRTVRPIMPETSLGWAMGLEVRWVPVRWERLGVVAGARIESPFSFVESCGADAWFPLCGDSYFRTLTAGLSWRFGKGPGEP